MRKTPSHSSYWAAENMELSREGEGLDLVLLTAALVLVGLGLVLVYSSSAVFAQAKYGDGAYFFRRHVIYLVLGLGALAAGYRFDYRHYQRLAYPLLVATLALLVALLVPGFGTHVDGATRWFRLGGLSFQPTELAKFTLVLYLAHSLVRKQKQMRLFSIGFLPHLIVAGVVSALVLKQPDLGSAVILLAVTLILLFVAGTKLSYIVVAMLAAAPVAYQQIAGSPWRLKRLLVFLDPWAYRQDAGYQISESLISVGSGGLWGQGLGAGKQKLFFLPAAHTDFIFATTGEELGFIGILLVIMLFVVLLARAVRAAYRAPDLFGIYLAFGLCTTLALQALLHMGVVLGLLPTKGITLPLFSYGGSGLVVNLLSVGVLLNIAARNPVSDRVAATERKAGSRANRRRVPRVIVATSKRHCTG